MIDVNEFVQTLTQSGVDFFCGVPDSPLKSFCAYVTDRSVEKVGGESRSTKDVEDPLSTSTSSLLSSPHDHDFLTIGSMGHASMIALGIAKSCGYRLTSDEDVASPLFKEIRVAKGARKDLGRPKEAPQANKSLFMETLSAMVFPYVCINNGPPPYTYTYSPTPYRLKATSRNLFTPGLFGPGVSRFFSASAFGIIRAYGREGRVVRSHRRR